MSSSPHTSKEHESAAFEIEVVDTDSGFSIEEEVAQAKKIPISDEFRKFVKQKKKLVENRFKLIINFFENARKQKRKQTVNGEGTKTNEK